MSRPDVNKKAATGAQNTGEPNGTDTSNDNPPDIISMFQDNGSKEDMASGEPIASELTTGASADAKVPGGDVPQGSKPATEPLPGDTNVAAGDAIHAGGSGTGNAPDQPQPGSGRVASGPTEGDAARAAMEERIKRLEAENAALRGRDTPLEEKSQALPGRDTVEDVSADEIRKYVKWQMKPRTKEMNIIGQGVKTVLLGYEPEKALGHTEIPQRIAMVLNQQTPNNMHHYFLEGKEQFVDAEQYF